MAFVGILCYHYGYFNAVSVSGHGHIRAVHVITASLGIIVTLNNTSTTLRLIPALNLTATVNHFIWINMDYLPLDHVPNVHMFLN